MSRVIGIMGESGAGKSTSLRNLDPTTTYIIDCDRKGLPWKGWRNQYSVDKLNYFQTDNPSLVMNIMTKINKQDNMSHVRTLVIDTINGVMVAEEMRRAKEQGYGKWTDLAQYVWEIFDFALTMRDDLTVVVIAHAITDTDDNGIVFTHIRTNGRKLEKIVLESKLNVVLLADCVDGQYVFRTKPERSSVKAPIGMFETETIPNDLTLVLDAMKDY